MRLYSLPPSAAFLDDLAEGLIRDTGARDNPAALADALVFLPNRRAAREFSLALFRAMDGTIIAPHIRTLGDVEEDETPDAIGPESLDLPPALSSARRRGALARLISAWRAAQGEAPLPPTSALAAADELARLLDQAAMAGDVNWDKLAEIAPEADLAEHWRKSADFLDIVVHAWPLHLAENKVIDPAERRRRAAELVAERWLKTRPRHPIIIAGSTGAGAATRALMKAVLQLPKGAIVLPGLDPDLDLSGWAAVARAPSHPQYVLLQTLQSLGVGPQAVEQWHVADETGHQRARRRLLNEALAPAEATRDWTERLIHLAKPAGAADLVNDGLKKLSIIEAEDESEEALVAALLLRETLESKTATAALVAPEAGLGRRVAAILGRWGISVGPSAGTPLNRTPAGSFILAVMRWARDPADPVLLLSVLKHELAGVGRDPKTLGDTVSRLERRALRGPRLSPTLRHLAVRLRADERLREADLIRDVEEIYAPYADDLAAIITEGAGAAEAAARLCEQLAATPQRPTGDRLWTGRSGAMAAQFLEQVAQISAEMGGTTGEAWLGLAEAVASRMIAAPEAPEHPRIAIWGPLEARLQRRDRMILSGLNEGSWPKLAQADAFLNRALRKKLGLPDPDERIGLAAHDFAQMACAPEVILLRAKRVDGKPAVASRWLWRLRTLAAGGLGDRNAADEAMTLPPEQDALSWAHTLRAPGDVAAAKPPQPRPPANARALDEFSPSRIAQLIRDPYADYARKILKLDALRRAGEEPDAMARGTAVHAAVDKFERSHDAGSLDALIIEALAAAGSSPELIAFEHPLWLRAANAYLRWTTSRRPRVRMYETEKRAETLIGTDIGPVRLHAKADRIELLDDGTLAIIDFKTGAPKTPAQVFSGLEPQLAIEAIIAASAGFGDIPPAQTSELIYVRLSTSAATASEKNGEPLDFSKQESSTPEVIAKTLEGVKRLIGFYGDPDQPYLSKPRAEFTWTASDYDRLARRAEWTVEEGDE